MSAVMKTYGSSEISFERGEGMYLYTESGDKYLDFCSGIAVSALGHSHPHLINAIKEQTEKLLHVSNLYKIPGQEKMAKRLVENTFASSVFFCNSGAEAVECGIKLARKFHYENGDPDRFRIITCSNSFHGRTLATLSAAKQEKHMAGFAPMLDGFDQVHIEDIEKLEEVVSESTACILLEPVQGEGGVVVTSNHYLEKIQQISESTGALIFFDEVQCGIARTGKLFAHEWSSVKPDIMSLAKGLGGGIPVGACLANKKVSSAMKPGSHGSTFGGNPTSMAAANAVFDIVEKTTFLKHVQEIGKYFNDSLVSLGQETNIFGEVRGMGLLVGIVCNITNTDMVKALEDNGLLTVAAGDNVVRFLPPLITEKHHIDEAVAILNDVCRQLST